MRTIKDAIQEACGTYHEVGDTVPLRYTVAGKDYTHNLKWEVGAEPVVSDDSTRAFHLWFRSCISKDLDNGSVKYVVETDSDGKIRKQVWIYPITDKDEA